MAFRIGKIIERVYGECGSLVRPLLIFAMLLGATSAALAQIAAEDDVQRVPPPLKMVPKADRDALNREDGINDRTKLALQMMEVRIVNAETANRADDLTKVFDELGIFHALMEETLSFLGANERMTGKVLDNFKRFELGLRRFTPRLEMIRREMPITHEFYLRSLLRQLRDARTKATEPLFGNSVIREGT